MLRLAQCTERAFYTSAIAKRKYLKGEQSIEQLPVRLPIAGPADEQLIRAQALSRGDLCESLF